MSATTSRLPRTADPLLDAAGIELDPAVDPYCCPACLARGDSCDTHRGIAIGWDRALATFAAALLGLDPPGVTP